MVDSLYKYYVEHYFILKICYIRTSSPDDGSPEISWITNVPQIMDNVQGNICVSRVPTPIITGGLYCKVCCLLQRGPSRWIHITKKGTGTDK